MPFHWTRLQASPPVERRDELEKTCKRKGWRLVDNEIFYDADENMWALIEVREGEDPQVLFDELNPISSLGLIDAVEKEMGKTPPPSKNPPPPPGGAGQEAETNPEQDAEAD